MQQSDNMSEKHIKKTNNMLERVLRIGIVLLTIGALTVGLSGWIKFIGGLCLFFGLLGTIFPAMMLHQSNSK